MNNASRILEAALEYARRGWPVFPCRGKDPVTEHGCKDATTDPAIIMAWWQGKHRGCNVAIATGGTAGQSHMKNPVGGSTQRNPSYEQRNAPTRVPLRSGTLDPS
jgi:hypothetical protein